MAGKGKGKCDLVFLVANPGIGGVARQITNVAHELQARGHRVRTFFPETSQFPATAAWCRRQGVEIEPAPPTLDETAARPLRATADLWRFVRTLDAPLVSIQYGTSYLIPKDILMVRLAGRRCIAGANGGHNLSGGDRKYIEKTNQKTRLAAQWCRAVNVVSPWSRDILIQAGVPARKIHVIPPGLRIPDNPPDKRAARERLGIRAEDFVVTTHGRLVHDKGMWVLIDAVARVPDPEEKLRLVIAGEGPDRAALEKQAAELLRPGQCLFVGHRDDVDELYAASDVFALATYVESFGIVFVEAAFHGVPSIGTTAGAVPHTVLDGQTGLIVPVEHPQALSEAMKKLWIDAGLRRRLGEAARQRAVDEFSQSVVTDQYEQMFGLASRHTQIK